MPSGSGWVWVKKKKRKIGDGARWPESAKLKAAATYAALGNLSETANLLNIPRDTMVLWTKTEWWKKAIEDVMYQDNAELDAKLKKVLEKSLEQVEERLQNGDYYYDPKTGQVRRIPAKLRDVQKVTTDIIDKRILMEKQREKALSREQNEKTAITGDHLVELAKVFADMAQGKTNVIKEKHAEIIEGDYETLDELGIETEKENEK